MAINFNPFKIRPARALRIEEEEEELTGDAVSRAAAEIEKELNHDPMGSFPAVTSTRMPKSGGITIDEVRVYSNGVMIASMPINQGRPVTLQKGETFTLTDVTMTMS